MKVLKFFPEQSFQRQFNSFDDDASNFLPAIDVDRLHALSMISKDVNKSMASTGSYPLSFDRMTLSSGGNSSMTSSANSFSSIMFMTSILSGLNLAPIIKHRKVQPFVASFSGSLKLRLASFSDSEDISERRGLTDHKFLKHPLMVSISLNGIKHHPYLYCNKFIVPDTGLELHGTVQV